MYNKRGTSVETTAVLSVSEPQKIGNSNLNNHESDYLIQWICKIQVGHKVLIHFDKGIEYFNYCHVVLVSLHM